MVQFAEDRSCITQFELGEMFQSSNPRTRDYGQAVKWYEESAKQGYRRAQHRLGTMYARGTGVPRDFIKAYAWCLVAAAQHSRRAMLKLKKLKPYLSGDQISSARKLSRQYYDMYVAPYAH